MHRTADNWDTFTQLWSGPLNFRISPSLMNLSFNFPPLETIIDQIRQDDHGMARSGRKGAHLNLEQIPMEQFRQIPIDELMVSRFSLSHFALRRFDAPGLFLQGFEEQVLKPMQAQLTAHGYTWERCYPIVFISGQGCATNYHMDLSHVLAWQVYGTKRFCGLKDPDRWADKNIRLTHDRTNLPKPDAIREEDALCYDMRPGEQLWNVLLTPHWVEAGDEPAMSLNISFGNLCHRGQLSPNEAELEAFRISHPQQARKKLTSTY